MQINQLSIRGFRGFNNRQTLIFHSRLTVIYAPNSYGKTSISEAIEWLLYGTTSKIDYADSKEEYRGSLRNLHLPEAQTPEVEVIFQEGEEEIAYRSELTHTDSILRTINGKPTECWPTLTEINIAARPFILQHTLKELLLAKPNERFEGIARLLGFNDLDQIQRDIISFCTKPDVHIPSQVHELCRSVSKIESLLQLRPNLNNIAKAYKKGIANWPTTIRLIYEAAHRYVPADTPNEDILPQLQKQREETVRRIFPGHLHLNAYSKAEIAQIVTESQYFLGCLTSEFIASYTQLIGLSTSKAIEERIEFFRLGIQFLSTIPEKCPLCGQSLADGHYLELHANHKQMAEQQKASQALVMQRTEVAREVKNLRTRITQNQNKLVERFSPIIEVVKIPNSFEKLKTLLNKYSVLDIATIQKAALDIAERQDHLLSEFRNINITCDAIEASLKGERPIEQTLMLALGEKLVTYVAATEYAIQVVNKHAELINLAGQMLRQELDQRAGTEDISILIDLLSHHSMIAKKLEIDAILAGLKDFRKSVDQFVSTEIENTVTRTFTADVSTWYNKVRTTTDPDVHFGGFDLEKTVKGETKARRVRINATSYGKSLKSAVSSLSESKLNALGICISIAMNMRHAKPFKFLIIDDPIQSLDAEHEAQFVEVIRELVEQGKQIILLSHNKHWVNAVRSGCRSVNGQMYEITGYDLSGPLISEKAWVSQQERFNEIEAILSDQMADNVRLQHAEEEVRILICELTAQIAKKVLGKPFSQYDLNASKVRALLTTCNVNQRLIDRIGQTFSTTDPAHHAPDDYAPHRQRIQQYRGYLNELVQVLKNAKPVNVAATPTSSKAHPVQRLYPAPPDVLDHTQHTEGNFIPPIPTSAPKD